MLFAEKKSKGSFFLCVDYRSLNANIVTDAWLLPRIDDLPSRLKGARVFNSLDLQDSYH